jgi:hypothetical protein
MDDNQRREAERAHDRDDEAWHKSNDAAISSATVALRTGVLINGGAAIAMLAFIGGLLKDSKLTLGPALTGITLPLMWFAYGVVASVVAMGLMYLVNFANTLLLSSRETSWSPPYIVEKRSSRWWRRLSRALTILAILGNLAAIGFFVYGMIEVRNAISTLHPILN